MPNDLNVAVSFTYPLAHVKTADRGNLEDRIYLVLECLLHNPTRKEVEQYFSHEHKVPLGDPAAKGVFSDFAPKWLGESIDSPFPVPLPPGTVIQITTNRDEHGVPFIPARTIGAGGPPFGVETGKWANTMLVNGLSFRKLENPDDDIFDSAGKRILSGDEWAILLNWAIKHLKDLFVTDESPSATEFPFRYALHTKLKTHYETAVKQTDPAADVNRTNQAWWAAFLETKIETESGAGSKLTLTVIAWMLHTARKIALTEETEHDRLSFPTFEYSPDYIRQNEPQLFPPGRDTYAEIFWTEFRKRLGPGPYSDKQYADNRAELKRGIFAGERLFWPRSAASTHETDIMRIPGAPPSEPAKDTPTALAWPELNEDGWQWTNTVSLLGQCFGIIRAELDGLKITGISISDADHQSPVTGLDKQAIDDLNDALERFGEEAALAAKGEKLSLRVERPEASINSIGRMRYQPRMTTLDPDTTVPNGYENRLLTVPKTILDALEGQAEWDMPKINPACGPNVDPACAPETARMVRQTPQRIMVTLKDANKDPKYPAWGDILPVEEQMSLFEEFGILRLRATVTRERLAGLAEMKQKNELATEHHLLRFKFDTDATGDGVSDTIHYNDVQEMKERAQAPQDALIWYGPSEAQEEAVLEKSLVVLHDKDPLSFIISVGKDGGSPKFKPFLAAYLEAEQTVVEKMNRVPDGADEKGQRARRYPKDFSFAVEILFRLKTTGGKRFNAILLNTPTEVPHYIALAAHFNYDSFNCSDTLYRRFYLRHFYHESLDDPWSGPELSDAEQGSRIAATFFGALKAFVYLSTTNPLLPVILPVEVEDHRLNVRDHQLPLDPKILPSDDKQHTSPPPNYKDAKPAGMPDRGYEILHSFANPTDERTTSTKEERYVRETQRFQFHALAGTEWQLQVRTDTRYGYPMVGISDDSRPLPLFSPVAHPALHLVNLNKIKAEASVEMETGDDLPAEPMLSFDFYQQLSGDESWGPEYVSLRLSGLYFRKILSGKPRPKHLEDDKKENVDPDMRGLRDIYETLLDLFTAPVQADGQPYSDVTMCLEVWNFDNRKRGALSALPGWLGGIAEDAEYPSLVGSLTWVRTLQLSLTAPKDAPDDDPRIILRERIRNLIIPNGKLGTFPDFVHALEEQFPQSDTPDIVFQFPLRHPLAQWKDAKTDQVYEGGDGDITDLANIVRVGLMIKRHSIRVPDSSLEVKPADIHPLLLVPEKDKKSGKPASACGIPSWMQRLDNGETWQPTAESKTIAELAIRHLNRYLNSGAEAAGPSELHERFDWLHVDPRTRDNRSIDENDPQLPKRILGPAYPYAKLPKGLRDSRDGAEQVDIFSVPVAFVQFAAILPFTDRQSSIEYVQFLFDILQSLCDGQTPTTIGVKPLEVENPQNGVEDLRKAREDALNLRDGKKDKDGKGEIVGIVETLLMDNFLSHVEDDEIIDDGDFKYQGELRNWSGFQDLCNGSGDSPDIVAAQNVRLNHVRKLRKAIFDEKSGRARAIIGELLSRDLRLYTRAKGFAIHIFDPIGLGKNPFDERLYSCKIDKFIRQNLWLDAGDILEPEMIQGALKAPPDADADMVALRNLCMRSETSLLLESIKNTNGTDLLKLRIARLFTYMIDAYDLDKMMGSVLSHWRERSLDHWRLDHLIKNKYFGPNPFNGGTAEPEEAVARRLIARRNRLIIERILTTALNPDKPRNPEHPPFVPFDKVDNDRFTFLNIHSQVVHDNETNADIDIRFLVDVLEDADYDSEYEVAHHLSLARSADDVLENKNQYGELKDAGKDKADSSRDDYGAEPADPRSLELIVVPHNPEWREWLQPRSTSNLGFNADSPKRPARWYYVLPSRRPPQIPLPLEVWESFTGPETEERSSSDLVTRADWRNRAQHIFPDAANSLDGDKLRQAYEKNYTAWTDYGGANPIYLRDTSSGSTSGTTRPEALVPLAPRDSTMTTQELYQDVDSRYSGSNLSQYGKAIEGWHKLENYIAHVDFEVRPDEEATTDNLLDGFRNDTLRIEVDEFAIGQPPTPETSTTKPELDPQPGLIGWYQYQRSLDRAVKNGDERKVVPPEPMTVPKILKELTTELAKLSDPKNAPKFPRETDDSVSSTVRRRVTRIALANTADVLRVLRTERNLNSGPAPAYGHLIDARMFTFSRKSDSGDNIILPRVVLRLSFLCCALFNYRVRIKVRRNFRDVDRDGDTDMNPRFQMSSDASAWVNLNHFTVLRSPSIKGSMPADLQLLQAPSDSETRKEWYEREFDTTAVDTFGDPLGSMMKGKGFTEYWEQESPRQTDDHIPIYELETIKKQLAVSALHLAALPDRTQPLHRQHNELTEKPEASSRNPDRDTFKSEALAVATLDGLPSLFKVSKADAPSVSKAFTLTWHYRLGEVTPADQEIGSNLKVLEIHTWPYCWPIKEV